MNFIGIPEFYWHTGLWMQELDAGLWTLDPECWTLDTGRWTLDSGRWALDPVVEQNHDPVSDLA